MSVEERQYCTECFETNETDTINEQWEECDCGGHIESKTEPCCCGCECCVECMKYYPYAMCDDCDSCKECCTCEAKEQ